MELKFFLILSFLSVALAALSPEDYWNSKLPQTPMPKALKDILQNEWLEEKGTSVVVGKGGVNVNTGKGKPSGGSTGATNGKPKTNVGVGKGGVHVRTGHKGRPVYVGVQPGHNPFDYNYAATKTQLLDDPNTLLFFLEKDIHKGTTMNLHFVKSESGEKFLQRDVAESIPFSSKHLPEIYQEFSVKPESLEAEIMQKTINECEKKGIEGEERYCATSLESMVDFSISKLGKNVQVISTQAKETGLQKYEIVGVRKVLSDEKAVVCHKQNYAYAVFYCHKTPTTSAYLVALVGADGSNAKAVAVCHNDTSKWNPKHFAFQLLKVKPGTVPICHFLPEDHIVWIRK